MLQDKKKKKWPKQKNRSKLQKKIQLKIEQIANLSDAQSKTRVIRKLTELVESVRKPDEKMKPMLRETKENVPLLIVMRRKRGLKSTVWTRRKKETFNQKRMKKQEFKKMKRGLRTSRTS